MHEILALIYTRQQQSLWSLLFCNYQFCCDHLILFTFFFQCIFFTTVGYMFFHLSISVYAHLKAHILIKLHTMQIFEFIQINQIFGYVHVQMYRRAINAYVGSRNTICIHFYLFLVPFGPVLTLFNTQTQFYMIPIWY